MSASDNNKKIAKNTIFLGIRMVFVLLITLYTTRVVLSSLGVVDYGVYTVVAGFVTMCAFISTSMANGIQRYFNFELGKNGTEGAVQVFNTGFFIQVIFAAVIILFTELVGVWYVNHKMVIPPDRLYAARWLLQLSILNLTLSMLQVPFKASIMAHEKMDYYAIVSILDALLRLGVAFAIKYSPTDRLIFYGALVSVIHFINICLYTIYSKIHFEEIRFERGFNKTLFKSMLVFSGWNLFGTFARTMRNQGLGMVLNLFFGPVVNAAQGVANQVSNGFNNLVANLSTASRPQIVQSYSQGNLDRSIRLMMSVSKLTTLLLYMVAYPILIEIDYVLQIWLGDNIPEGTRYLIIIVVITMFVSNLQSFISSIVHATGKMKTYQLTCSIINILIVPAAYFACKMGANVEIVFIIGFVIEVMVFIASIIILKHLIRFSVREYLKKVIMPVAMVMLITIIIPIIPHFLLPIGFVRFVLVLIIAILASSICSYYLGISNQEKEIVRTILRIKKNHRI